MEAFRDQFTATELLSYKEVLYDQATEEWYAQHDPDEVDHEERNCMCLAQQFCPLKKGYRERFFTYVLFQPQSVAVHLVSYLLDVYYTSELDNLHDDIEIDQLGLDWIAWQRNYALNKVWGDCRTSILEAMQCKL